MDTTTRLDRTAAPAVDRPDLCEPPTMGWAMAAAEASVPALRALACMTASRWGLTLSDDGALALVVSELVGNAVRHSGAAQVRLTVSATATTLTVEVQDSGTWRPRGPGASAEDLECGGRGLQLVEAYAVGFAIRSGEGGTRVTAVLALRGQADACRTSPRLPGARPRASVRATGR
ncbi:ATP-binding protein [Kitasatospora sp. NPDC051853]|uniref:ATP-binding protein n=1 Tax=Kitasatospora sp. NPDC051853 TaxID=3364058 RepID=UPI0037903B69